MPMGHRLRRLAAEAIPAAFRLAASYAQPRLPKDYNEWKRETASKMNAAEVEGFARWVEERGRMVAEGFHCPRCKEEIAAEAKAYADRLRVNAPKYARYEQIRFKREDLDRMAREALKHLEEMTKAAEQTHDEHVKEGKPNAVPQGSPST